MSYPIIEKQEELISVNHIIGGARTVATAILVTEYLRKRYSIRCKINESCFEYRFKEPTHKNGFWLADILVRSCQLDLKDSELLVEACRAFVAGREEIWT